MYYPRHLEAVLREAVTQFPAVAVMGARQVGKSTLLQQLFSTEYTYLTFDDILLRTQAKADPALFLKNFPGKKRDAGYLWFYFPSFLALKKPG